MDPFFFIKSTKIGIFYRYGSSEITTFWDPCSAAISSSIFSNAHHTNSLTLEWEAHSEVERLLCSAWRQSSHIGWVLSLPLESENNPFLPLALPLCPSFRHNLVRLWILDACVQERRAVRRVQHRRSSCLAPAVPAVNRLYYIHTGCLFLLFRPENDLVLAR